MKVIEKRCTETDFETIKASIGWQRVDPRTVFNQELFTENPNADDTQALIDELLSNDDYWEDPEQKAGKILQFFQPWPFWTRITEEE